jgi:hypothetical protein
VKPHVDAQLPKRLARWLATRGQDVLHTLDLRKARSCRARCGELDPGRLDRAPDAMYDAIRASGTWRPSLGLFRVQRRKAIASIV